mmetsp:Transcript_155910/g.499861  ORF Transcript_155910/g.499861 Transcript_155910/m.499861 type:complete len:491 (-) Transcript_155910:222-1694(-)
MAFRSPGVAAVLVVLNLSSVSADDGPFPAYHELYYQQTLDHFQPVAHARWPHRYLLNNESWDGRGKLAHGCRGPILLYAGNEGPIEAFWSGNGFMIEELAPAWGGLLLFPEQRFYGQSLPFGNTSFSGAEHLTYLTTSQVVEDYVELLAHLKATMPGAANCPVVAFGGSYGGTLAALLRASHPAAITGALAASSELGYYDLAGWAAHGVTEFAFEDVVTEDYRSAVPGCLDAIQAATMLIEAAERSKVAEVFQVCEDKALGPRNSDLFIYALERLPQQDYPYAVGALPARPVTAACNLLMEPQRWGDPGALLKAAAAVASMAFGLSGSACIPYQGPGGPGNTPGDGSGPGAWGWQSCTETLHSFSARVLRNYTFDFKASASECSALYGISLAPPDTGLLARRYGGFALADGSAGVSRLIWSHGTLDPWHGWFRQMAQPSAQSDVHHFLMEGSAHHLDLRTPNPDDPPDVTAARRRMKEIIHGWFQEASII